MSRTRKATCRSRLSKKNSTIWSYIPKLIVFDLDFTIWYPEMYELGGPPFKKHHKTGAVVDRNGTQVHIFPAVHKVLKTITNDEQFLYHGTRIAVASKTEYPEWAKSCMKLLEVSVQAKASKGVRYDKVGEKRLLAELVQHEAIYPRNKRIHFQQLHDESGISYCDMLFFDNEYYNTVDVAKLGVVTCYCPQGLSEDAWLQGMRAFQESKVE